MLVSSLVSSGFLGGGLWIVELIGNYFVVDARPLTDNNEPNRKNKPAANPQITLRVSPEPKSKPKFKSERVLLPPSALALMAESEPEPESCSQHA